MCIIAAVFRFQRTCSNWLYACATWLAIEIIRILGSHDNAIPAPCSFAKTHNSGLVTKFMFLRRIMTIVILICSNCST